MAKNWLTIAVMVATAVSMFSQVNVTGTVFGENQERLAGASVEAFPIRNTGFAGNLHWVKADQNGDFLLSLSPGQYEIRGKNETGGYPDPNSLFAVSPKAVFPLVTVEREPLRGVQVRLGPRGGVLEGNIRDADTAKPISEAKVLIRAVGNPERFVDLSATESGRFEYAIPPKAVIVCASGNGYRSSCGTEINLSGGEHRSIVVQLEPVRRD